MDVTHQSNHVSMTVKTPLPARRIVGYLQVALQVCRYGTGFFYFADKGHRAFTFFSKMRSEIHIYVKLLTFQPAETENNYFSNTDFVSISNG